MATSSVNPSPARVILLCGPSGSGKSTLAERAGLPVLQLDDFYKDGDDPTLPRLHDDSVDWDDPRSWHFDQAVAAIRALCGTGTTEVPVYSIPANGRVDARTLTIDSPVFLAEGIFAAEIVRACEAEGLLADAICLRNHALTTAYRRFLRDVREARKSVPYLLRRGYRLMRAERAVVTRQKDLGAVPCNGREALQRVSAREREALPVQPTAA
ncbi:uridine kinase [Streptacidiphilus sp. BW17]|uniref:uridine kinase family protein n=1 Tax=Streptacidiphilus sp. BW17 TaxID=3156274 RepID=UPI0035112826